MLVNQWNIEKINQFEKTTGQALLRDEQLLVSYSVDFGKLFHSQPIAVSKPKNLPSLNALIDFANTNRLPLTIRGNGLSQCGQSLPIPGGVTVCMQAFDSILDMNEDDIWVEANASWSRLLETSLSKNKAPYVLPYNCNLSIAGVLSAGGVGASSGRYGTINAHVKALEVIDGQGHLQIIDEKSPLFHACLSGQGRFAVITKACIVLKKVKTHVKTISFVYDDQTQWLKDVSYIREHADYLEAFCSPSILGTKALDGKRVPIVQWLYGLHLSFEVDDVHYESKDILQKMKPLRTLAVFSEPVKEYYLRHDGRFDLMKRLGQWDLLHPWYECFVPFSVLQTHLTEILSFLPVSYANLLHVVPIEPHKGGFLMTPKTDSLCSVMILNPGIPLELKPLCIEAIHKLDAIFVKNGGKRYLSGYLGDQIDSAFWKSHFEKDYMSWVNLKQVFDPNGIFTSYLHPM